MSKVTLTFDNGPDPDVTPRVLDVLARAGVQAHFFVLGKNLVDAPGRRLVERALAEGHAVGNHSFSHAVPLGEDPRPDAVEAEIVATESLLAPLVRGPKRFRPFGGGGLLGKHLLSRRAAIYLTEHAYSCVLWSSVPRDWVDEAGWSKTALSSLPASASAGEREHSVVVLHDIPNACLAGLPGFLAAARDAGAEFVLDLPPDCTPIVDGAVPRPDDLEALIGLEGA